jgi:hypothetical protein
MTRGHRDWLGLRCTELASATTCRSPGAQRMFDPGCSPSAKTPPGDSLSAGRSAPKSRGIRLFFADGCAPWAGAGSSKCLSDARHSLRLLYSGNRERQLLSFRRRALGSPAGFALLFGVDAGRPMMGSEGEGRTICSTAMSLRRPPQRADLPFPSSPARDIPPPCGGARKAAASAAARCFMR